jgi:uncharacterized protein YkwD
LRRPSAHAAQTATHSTRTPAAFQRPVARIAVAVTALTIVILAARQGPSEATPQPIPLVPASILPTNVGVGLATNLPVNLEFSQPMSAASVADGLQIYPEAFTKLSWSSDGRHLAIAPAPRWQTDERYVLVLPGSVRLANGSVLGAALRYSFTTSTAPTVTEFSIHRSERGAASKWPAQDQSVASDRSQLPADTTAQASAMATINISFSAAMNRAEVERSFLITPAVPGTMSWGGTTLTFTPSVRLNPATRYAVAVVGVHDSSGNRLAGDIAFSFTIASRARVSKVAPADGAKGIEPRTVRVWFSTAVDPEATAAAFRLVDMNLKEAVAGTLSWNADRTQLRYLARSALPKGHRFEIRILKGARDADGNPLSATFGFTTRAAAPAAPKTSSGPLYAAPSPSGSVQSYALALINASRRAFGFAPLALDARLSAVASAHAWDQIRYGYFSHYSRDGSSYRDRITAAGISWSHAGENQCEDYGSITHAISWCHSYMMAEPYPGVWNHIANILDPNFTRVGFGYGRASDGRLVMTWDFIG